MDKPKLIKTIKQYQNTCSQCGDSFITYKPKDELLCYRCKQNEDARKHNIATSELHRWLLQRMVTITHIDIVSCRNRNYFSSIKLVDKNGNIITIDTERTSDYEDDVWTLDIQVKEINK